MCLRFYIENKVGVYIIDSNPHNHIANALKNSKNKKLGYVSKKRTKMEYLSTIVFHPIILKCFEKGQKNQDKVEILSAIVFYNVILKCFQKGTKTRNVATLLYRGQSSWCIIDIIQQCLTGMASKRSKS